jgi:hypothetical protein
MQTVLHAGLNSAIGTYVKAPGPACSARFVLTDFYMDTISDSSRLVMKWQLGLLRQDGSVALSRTETTVSQKAIVSRAQYPESVASLLDSVVERIGAALATGLREPAPGAQSGRGVGSKDCGSDRECKGERICERGVCVSPRGSN